MWLPEGHLTFPNEHSNSICLAHNFPFAQHVRQVWINYDPKQIDTVARSPAFRCYLRCPKGIHILII